jgi:hypothetical protein
MYSPPALRPARKLQLDLDSGAMFTKLAEDACGQGVRAEVDRVNPPWLSGDEAARLGMSMPGDSWAALRRIGRLLQADGTPVARVTSVVAAGRLDRETVLQLTATDAPLGTVLAAAAERDGTKVRGEVTGCSMGLDQYAVHCWRVLLLDDVPVALATEQVLWSWLNKVSGPVPSA